MYILDIFRDYKKNLLFQFFINIQKLHAECAAIKKYYCLNVTIIIVDYKILKRYEYI